MDRSPVGTTKPEFEDRLAYYIDARIDLNHLFNVNVNGTNIVTTTFLPLLRKSSVKKIINM
jgi:hypothetical protein